VVAGDAGTEPCAAAGWGLSAGQSPSRCWRKLRFTLTPLPELSAQDAPSSANTRKASGFQGFCRLCCGVLRAQERPDNECTQRHLRG